MATVKRHSVIIKDYVNVREELVAAEAITPGMLIELTSAGEVQKHSVAGGNVLPMFALEDELQGRGIDTAYAHEDVVSVWIPTKGDIVNCLLADGQHIEIGDFVESAGTGYVTKHVTDSAGVGTLSLQIVGQAIEHVDLSGSAGTHPVSGLRLKIRIV